MNILFHKLVNENETFSAEIIKKFEVMIKQFY